MDLGSIGFTYAGPKKATIQAFVLGSVVSSIGIFRDGLQASSWSDSCRLFLMAYRVNLRFVRPYIGNRIGVNGKIK